MRSWGPSEVRKKNIEQSMKGVSLMFDGYSRLGLNEEQFDKVFRVCGFGKPAAALLDGSLQQCHDFPFEGGG